MLAGGVPDGDGVVLPPTPPTFPVQPPPAGLLKEKIGESDIFCPF